MDKNKLAAELLKLAKDLSADESQDVNGEKIIEISRYIKCLDDCARSTTLAFDAAKVIAQKNEILKREYGFYFYDYYNIREDINHLRRLSENLNAVRGLALNEMTKTKD